MFCHLPWHGSDPIGSRVQLCFVFQLLGRKRAICHCVNVLVCSRHGLEELVRRRVSWGISVDPLLELLISD